jgi:preprotein translocase subunit SecE
MKTTNQKKKKKGVRKVNRADSNSVELKKVDVIPDKNIRESKAKGQPTIPRKGTEKGQGIKGLSKYINMTTQFLREAKFELKKVKWPTRKELLASTTMVIVLVLAVSLFLGLVDFILIKIIKMVIG